MQHQMMGYDRSATMFSPDGHILQVEYAEKTVRLGSASIGIVCTDGVILISDKKVNDKLVVTESSNKIHEVDSHIMISAAGILSDARVLIERAQLISQQHRVTFDSPVDTLAVIKDIASIKQQYTQHPGVRPFGVSVLVAGVDNGKPGLFGSDITGNYVEYYATAIGEDDDKIQAELRKHYRKDMNAKEGFKLALSIFKEMQGEGFNSNRFDAAVISKDDGKMQRVSSEELKKLI